MSWLISVVVIAAFVLARWTSAGHRQQPSVRVVDLRSWYRSWDFDSSDQHASVVELRQMLEAYRQNRRSQGQFSALPETEAVLETRDRPNAVAAA